MLWWVLATFEKTTSRFQSGPAINKWPNKEGLNKTNKSEILMHEAWLWLGPALYISLELPETEISNYIVII